MAKSTTHFVCAECGVNSPKWLGKCPSCNKWNTYQEEFIVSASANAPRAKFGAAQALPLNKIKEERFDRISSGISEFDDAVGGGIVPSSIILIGGEPGIGKSTLLTQVAGNLAEKHKVLYVCAEESAEQVKMRCKRLNVKSENLYLLCENELESIEQSAAGSAFLIIDSIQAIYISEMSSSAGSVAQVKECSARLMRLAKSQGITILVVGHVTKEGAIAGPKVLEHTMDTVLYFESEAKDNYRILHCVKNRFGSVDEIGVFEMRSDGIFAVKDYGGIFISDAKTAAAGAVITPVISGNRCIPVEVQSLVSQTVFGYPRRMPIGIDSNKFIVLLAVLEKRAGVPLYNQDAYLNIMGGLKISEPSLDLAVCASIAGSQKNIPCDKKTAVFGEVSLSGEIRGVLYADKRINECIKLGIERVVFPSYNYKSVQKYKDKIQLVPVNSLGQALGILYRN